MKHFATAAVWKLARALPPEIQKKATKQFELLKSTPHAPQLHFRPVGRLCSVRIDLNYRALGIAVDGGIVWFWVGPRKPPEANA